MKEKILSKLEDHSCFWIGIISRKIAKYYNRKLAPFGLTSQHFFILMYLWEKDGVKSKDLQDLLALESASLTGHIDRMEKAGLVKRQYDPDDRRAIRIYLTEKGKNMQTTLTPIGNELKTTMRKGIPRILVKIFKKGLDTINKRLD
ncbi:MAG: MarR family winged helix-turn-helix transcriptional regulator [Candidatus Anammoxibacter sp.]